MLSGTDDFLEQAAAKVQRSTPEAVIESEDPPLDSLETVQTSSSPTIEDFYALCPSNLRMPRDVDSTDTPEFAVYERRYKEMIHSLEKAFNRGQVIDFAKAAIKSSRTKWRTAGKRDMIKRIVAEKIGYTDPAVFKAAEKKRIQAAGKEASKMKEGKLACLH